MSAIAYTPNDDFDPNHRLKPAHIIEGLAAFDSYAAVTLKVVGGDYELTQGRTVFDLLTSDGNHPLNYSTAGYYFDLSGFDGPATIVGGKHEDKIVTGSGNDNISSNGGADIISTQGGNDRVVVSATPSYLDGGSGTDTLVITGNVSLNNNDFFNFEIVGVTSGGVANLSSVSKAPSQIISTSVAGQPGATIYGTKGNDHIYGGSGDDVISGNGGTNYIYAGSGSETINYTGTKNVIVNAKFNYDTFDFSEAAPDDGYLHFLTKIIGGLNYGIASTEDGIASSDAFWFKGYTGAQVQAHGHFIVGEWA